MTYPLVRELASDGIPVTVTCRVLKFSAQGYYQWLKKPCSKRDYDNAHLTNALIDLHRDDPTFGYRFMADELELLEEFVGDVDLLGLHEEGKVGQEARRPCPRRLGATQLQRITTERTLVHRYHRAPHERGQALHGLDRGRLLGAHRRLFDWPTHDETPGLRRTAQRDCPA